MDFTAFVVRQQHSEYTIYRNNHGKRSHRENDTRVSLRVRVLSKGFIHSVCREKLPLLWREQKMVTEAKYSREHDRPQRRTQGFQEEVQGEVQGELQGVHHAQVLQPCQTKNRRKWSMIYSYSVTRLSFRLRVGVRRGPDQWSPCTTALPHAVST